MTAAQFELSQTRSNAFWTLDADDRMLRRFALISMALLPIMTFTIPGQDSPSSQKFLDGLAFIKLLILIFVCGGGSVVMMLQSRRALFQRIVTPLFPWIVFLGWSVLSVTWSPLKAVSLGQAGGLAALILYAIAIGMICYDADMVPRVLRQLGVVLLAFSLFILAVQFLSPESSGLDRTLINSGGDGVVHPTSSGAAAALGLLLVVLCGFVGKFRWPWWLLIGSAMVHSAVLYYSNSRTSTLLGLTIAATVLFLFSNNRKRAWSLIATAGLLIAVITLDPGFERISESAGAGVDYFARGQSVEEIRQVSGRAEMWSAIWAEFLKSPVIGHGYAVTSETGSLEVWNVVTNHTSHNIHLQVLVTTGVVGMLLFVIAMGTLLLHFQNLRGRGGLPAKVGWMLAFSALWFFGWSLTCISFLGHVRAESVVFFTFVGIGVGQASRCLVDATSSGNRSRPSGGTTS